MKATQRVQPADGGEESGPAAASIATPAGAATTPKAAAAVKDDWTEEEEVRLQGAISQHGTSAWEPVAAEFQTRTAAECKSRWIHHPRREDGTLLKILPGRSAIHAIVSTLQTALGGAHVEMDVTKAECSKLPQLNPKNPNQYSWIQFMVWRRWMMMAALCVSVVICGVTVGQIKVQFDHLYDVLDRCKSSENSTILDPSGSGQRVERAALLDKLLAPIEPLNIYRSECTATSTSDTAPASITVGSPLSCEKEVFAGGLTEQASVTIHGKCKWFPFAPWTKEPPPTPVKPNNTKGSTISALNIGADANFLGQLGNSGCGTDGSHKSKQYTQSQACACSHALQVFENYSWLNLDAAEIKDVFVTGNESAPASQRNLIRFMQPKYCQAPERSYATTCAGAGCIEMVHNGAGYEPTFLHPERCSVRTPGVEKPACAADKASCCSNNHTALAQLLFDQGRQQGASAPVPTTCSQLFDEDTSSSCVDDDVLINEVSGGMVQDCASHSYFCDEDWFRTPCCATCHRAAVEDMCRSTEWHTSPYAGLCALECTERGHSNACTREETTTTAGMIGHIGEYKVCYTSEDAQNYRADEYVDRFPALEVRKCCSPSEYLFTSALWNDNKWAYEMLMLACDVFIALNNVLMAVLGLHTWATWRKSRRYVLFAWLFPFILKFMALSIPAYEAQAVDEKAVANLTIDYGLKQFGYRNFDELKQVSQTFVTDAMRMGAVSGGEVNELLKSTGLKCSPELQQSISQFQDTFKEDELDAIDAAVFGAEKPECAVDKASCCSDDPDALAQFLIDSGYIDEAYLHNYLGGAVTCSMAFDDSGTTAQNVSDWCEDTSSFGDFCALECVQRGHINPCTREDSPKMHTDPSRPPLGPPDTYNPAEFNPKAFPAGYSLLRYFIFKSGDSRTPDGEYAAFVTEEEYGSGSRCAKIVHGAETLSAWVSRDLEPGICCNADALSWATQPPYNLVDGLPIAEATICENLEFCNFFSGPEPSSCCGSCMPYFLALQAKAQDDAPPEVATNLNPDEESTRTAEQLQTQSWGTGLAQCIEEGTVTSENKNCSMPQATYARKLKDELPRMFSCDPKGSLQFIQSVHGNTPFDSAASRTVPALGSCADLDNQNNRCFDMYTGVPFALDMQLPYAMEQAAVVLETVYTELMLSAQKAVMVGVRMSGAMKAAIGLLPITMAILPGMCKGAEKTKLIVPQTALISYGLVVFPLLQLPMLGTVMCVMVQAGGTWKIFGAVWLFMAAQIAPFVPGLNALGPHDKPRTFKLMFKDARLPIFKAACFTASLVLLVLSALDQDVQASVNLEEVMGQASQQVLLMVKVILNFVKAKTFTVVMSADLFLVLLTQLQMYSALRPETTKKCDERMIAGLLLERTPKEAAELLQEFDDGDGIFDEAELKLMIKRVYGHTTEKLEQFEEKAQLYLEKKRGGGADGGKSMLLAHATAAITPSASE